MNTKTLVVGQDVWIRSGCYYKKGKVVKVNLFGVQVQTGVQQIDGTWNAHEIFRFSPRGKGRYSQQTYEGGPWEIEMPIAEQK
jgi:hypothetical protein